MSNETKYLPGTIRDRIQDLIKSRKVTQAELAARIECSEATLSRFISGKTDKLGDENVIRIARAFEVSTDFLLGVVWTSLTAKITMWVSWGFLWRPHEIFTPTRSIRRWSAIF